MKANWRFEGFHLSVDKNGLVSLWDGEQVARSLNESYLFLKLTPEQTEAIERAHRLAARKEKRSGTTSQP